MKLAWLLNSDGKLEITWEQAKSLAAFLRDRGFDAWHGGTNESAVVEIIDGPVDVMKLSMAVCEWVAQ